MLNIAISFNEKQEKLPLKEAKKWLGEPGVKLRITENGIQVEGDVKSEMIHSLTAMGEITSLTNRRGNRENNVFETSKRNKNIDDAKTIKKGQVWLVDFGPMVDDKFAGPHPAIVLGKSSTNNCIKVLPCTSKTKSGRVYQMKFSKENLINADERFLESSASITTTVLLDDQQPVDRIQFLRCYGTLEGEMFKEILRTLGYTDGEIKRNITLRSLELSEKQAKIMEAVNRNSDVLGVANNESFTYEQRVRGILSIFGFKVQIGGDVDYLIRLIMNTKEKTGQINIAQESEVLAIGGIVNSKAIQGRIVELTKKRFKEIHPCLVDLVTLVNKMAA